MSGLNRDLLIENIRKLMEENNVTQKGLAEILGMSQPNVNHALNPKGTKCFTLEQVAGIAIYFGVSVDSLLGLEHESSREISPRFVAKLFSDLILKHDAKFFDCTIKERRFDVEYGSVPPYEPQCTDYVFDYPYVALYIPNRWDPDDIEDEEKRYEAFSEATQCGNETRMAEVNVFLKQFREIFTIYENGGLSKQTYDTVVSDLLTHLRDY